MTAGRLVWAISAGRIPVDSNGREPDFVSHDRLSILNAGEADADICMTIYFEDNEPVGPYRLKVKGRRVRSIRINDLIEPEALPLGIAYSIFIEATAPVIVQFGRLDSAISAGAAVSTIAFADPSESS